jgi:hypothetical protein
MRRSWGKGGWLAVLMVLLSALVLANAGLAVPSLTVGQASPAADSDCSGDYVLAQTAVSAGPSYVVPSGNWQITSWSTYAYGGQMGLIVLRPTAIPGSYTVVGASEVQTLASTNVLQTFSLDTPIAVQAGDLIGFWATDTTGGCALMSALGDTYVYAGPFLSQPSVGTVISATSETNRLLNISATLTDMTLPPALPTTEADCRNGGWERFGGFKNQGDCVSFVATGGKNPPASP